MQVHCGLVHRPSAQASTPQQQQQRPPAAPRGASKAARRRRRLSASPRKPAPGGQPHQKPQPQQPPAEPPGARRQARVPEGASERPRGPGRDGPGRSNAGETQLASADSAGPGGTVVPARPAGPAALLDCTHFAACSGCTLERELGAPPLLSRASAFFAECGLPDFRARLGPVHGWRCRARLAGRRRRRGGGGGGGGLGARELELGLFAAGSHDIIDIPHCSIHHPRINEAAALVRAAAAALRVEPYDEASGAGQLRYVQLTAVGQQPRAPRAQLDPMAAVQVVLVWNSSADSGHHDAVLRALGERLWREGALDAPRGAGGVPRQLVHSVWANFQPSRANAILGPDWALLHGDRFTWQVLGGARACFLPGSFMQANPGAMEAALGALGAWVPHGAAVADLHAGVGVVGLSLAARRGCRSVRFVEVNPLAEEPFLRAASELRAALASRSRSEPPSAHPRERDPRAVAPPEPKQPGGAAAGRQAALGSLLHALSSTHPEERASSGELPELEYHVAAAGAAPARWLAGVEVAVVDPPRKGLEGALLAALGQPQDRAPQLRRLVYLSCGFPALQRDTRQLLASGRWRLRHAEAFLFFPGTDSLETLAVFDRID